jgi:hypothetical protein
MTDDDTTACFGDVKYFDNRHKGKDVFACGDLGVCK